MRNAARFGLILTALGSAGASKAQVRIDYSALLTPEPAVTFSSFDKPPLSVVPFSSAPGTNELARLYGRIDLVPSFELYNGLFGVQVGLYSNEDVPHQGRGVVPFDDYNSNLTRIKPETPFNFDALALFYANPYGRFEIGYGAGVSERTAVTAPSNYGAGSIAGDYPYFLSKPHDVGFNTISAYGSANTSPRVLYMSPRYYGLQAGITYQPDTRDTGFDYTYGSTGLGILGRQPTATGTFEGLSAGFINVVEGGLNFDENFGGFRIKASLAAIRGDPVPSPTGTEFSRLASHQVGLQVGYGDWSGGAGFVDAGTSGYTKSATVHKRKEQYALEAGIQYAPRQWRFGADEPARRRNTPRDGDDVSPRPR